MKRKYCPVFYKRLFNFITGIVLYAESGWQYEWIHNVNNYTEDELCEAWQERLFGFIANKEYDDYKGSYYMSKEEKAHVESIAAKTTPTGLFFHFDIFLSERRLNDLYNRICLLSKKTNKSADNLIADMFNHFEEVRLENDMSYYDKIHYE